jgi:hypothetical protein
VAPRVLGERERKAGERRITIGACAMIMDITKPRNNVCTDASYASDENRRPEFIHRIPDTAPANRHLAALVVAIIRASSRQLASLAERHKPLLSFVYCL